MFFIKSLGEFTYNDQGIERGQGVRDKSEFIVDLLVHPDKLDKEKENAKQIRKKLSQDRVQNEEDENEESQQAKPESGFKAQLQNLASRVTEITTDTVQNLGEKYKDIKNSLNEKIYGVTPNQEIQEGTDSNDQSWGTHYGSYIESNKQQKLDQKQPNQSYNIKKSKLDKISQNEDSRTLNPLISSKPSQQSYQQQKAQTEQIDFLNFLEVPYQNTNSTQQDLLSQSVTQQQQKMDIFSDFEQQQPQKAQQSLNLFALQPQQQKVQNTQPQNIDLFTFQPTQEQKQEISFLDLIDNQQNTRNQPQAQSFTQIPFPGKTQANVQSQNQDQELFEDFVEAPQQVESQPQQNTVKPSKIQEDIFDLFKESNQNQKGKSESNQKQPDLFQVSNPQQQQQQNAPMGSYWDTHYSKQNVPAKQLDFNKVQQQSQKQALQLPQQQNAKQQSSQGSIDFFEFTQPQKQQGPMKSTPPPAKVAYKAPENPVKEKKDLLDLFEDFKI